MNPDDNNSAGPLPPTRPVGRRMLDGGALSGPIDSAGHGYQPPKSLSELMERYRDGERFFGGSTLPLTRFPMGDLTDMNLSASDLSNATFTLSQMYGVNFSRANLTSAFFNCTNMHQAKLDGTDLSRATFFSVTLVGATAVDAVLDGTQFLETRIHDMDLTQFRVLDVGSGRAFVDDLTLRRTSESLTANPNRLDDVERLLRSFSVARERWPWRADEGLSIFFDARLGQVERIVVEAVIAVTLGASKANEVDFEIRNRETGTIVRLNSPYLHDLELVAGALYASIRGTALTPLPTRRARRSRAPTMPSTAVVQTVEDSHHGIIRRMRALEDAIGTSFSGLMARIDRMELRAPMAAGQLAAPPVVEWCRDTHPRLALERLLSSVSADDLRVFASHLPDGHELTAELPGGSASAAVVGHDLIAQFERRGHALGTLLRHFARHFPQRAEHALWLWDSFGVRDQE